MVEDSELSSKDAYEAWGDKVKTKIFKFLLFNNFIINIFIQLEKIWFSRIKRSSFFLVCSS